MTASVDDDDDDDRALADALNLVSKYAAAPTSTPDRDEALPVSGTFASSRRPRGMSSGGTVTTGAAANGEWKRSEVNPHV
jgi:hypothetical protein